MLGVACHPILHPLLLALLCDPSLSLTDALGWSRGRRSALEMSPSQTVLKHHVNYDGNIMEISGGIVEFS